MSLGDDGTGLSALPGHALPRIGALPASPGRIERFPPLYGTLRAACSPLLRALFDLDILGLEHVPAAGPVVIAANHHNYLDGVVLGVAIPRPIAFLVMPRVYRATRLHPPFHRRVGSIALNVERSDPGAIKRALRALSDGRIVGIFPEGPFSRDGRLVPGQPGVGLIALRSGAPVIPAAIHGTYEALAGRRFYLPRRHPLSVRLGPPLSFGLPRRHSLDRAERDDAARRIMDAIAGLLDS